MKIKVKDIIEQKSLAQKRIDELEVFNYELVCALRDISQGIGPFSRDRLTHAENTIEAMKKIADEALKKAEVKW